MPLVVGTLAPDFTLRDQNNRPVTLADYRGRKSVLLVFFPLAFTGNCQGELELLRDNLPRFDNDELALLTVSVGPPVTHKVWASPNGFTFPLLSDFWPHGGVAQQYGVFNETIGFAIRGSFLIDAEGVLRWSVVNGPGEARPLAAYREALAAL